MLLILEFGLLSVYYLNTGFHRQYTPTNVVKNQELCNCWCNQEHVEYNALFIWELNTVGQNNLSCHWELNTVGGGLKLCQL